MLIVVAVTPGPSPTSWVTPLVDPPPPTPPGAADEPGIDELPPGPEPVPGMSGDECPCIGVPSGLVMVPAGVVTPSPSVPEALPAVAAPWSEPVVPQPAVSRTKPAAASARRTDRVM